MNAVYVAIQSNPTIEEACLELFGMYFAFIDTSGAWRMVIRQHKAPSGSVTCAAHPDTPSSIFYAHLFDLVSQLSGPLILIYEVIYDHFGFIRTDLARLWSSVISLDLAWSDCYTGWMIFRSCLEIVTTLLFGLRMALAALLTAPWFPGPRKPAPTLPQDDQLQSSFFKLPPEVRNAIYSYALEPVLNPGKSSPYPCPWAHRCPNHDNAWRVPVPNILLACRKIYNEVYQLPTSRIHTKLMDLPSMIQQVSKMHKPQLSSLFIVAPLPTDTRPPAQQALPNCDFYISGYSPWASRFASIFLSPYLCITPDIYVYWHEAPQWAQPVHHCGRMMQISGRQIGFDKLANNQAGTLEGILPRRGYREQTTVTLEIRGGSPWLNAPGPRGLLSVQYMFIMWKEDFTGLKTSYGSVWGINDVRDEDPPWC